jgi:hypothetical protein
MKNYGNTTFKPENDSYHQNANMSNTQTIGELRIGGEYVKKSLRAGISLRTKPL